MRPFRRLADPRPPAAPQPLPAAVVRLGLTRPLVLAALVLATAVATAVAAPGAGAQSYGLYATAGFERAAYDPEPLDRFTETYNAYYAARQEAPFPDVARALTRPVIGAAFRLQDGLYASVGYQYGRTGQRLETDLGAFGQTLDLRVTDHTVVAEMGAELGGGLYVAGVVGGVFRFERLLYSTTYADGSESLGNEVVPNGHYTGSTPYLDAGLAVGFSRGRVAIPLRVTYPVMTFDGLPLNDYDLYELRYYFPADWPRYLNDSSGLDDANAVFTDAFHGLRVTVGVEVRLLPF